MNCIFEYCGCPKMQVFASGKPKFFCLIRSETKISTTDADFKTLNQSVHPPQIVQNLIYCAIFNFFLAYGATVGCPLEQGYIFSSYYIYEIYS